MLEVYLDEVYDLLDPGKERKKLKVSLGSELSVYDEAGEMNKIWRASKDAEQAERFRQLGLQHRAVRSTGLNPSSSRGHCLLLLRLTTCTPGENPVDGRRAQVSLVDLAGSERHHDVV